MRLTKHHGLGNDFLVLLDEGATRRLDRELVRVLCDRHRGIGADGVIRAIPGPSDQAVAVMDLFNADGSRAEMSGNGIRCLAQALLIAGWVEGPDVGIRTDVGVRTVTLHGRPHGATHVLSVDMGPARLDGDAPAWVAGAVRRAAMVGMGNPHLVLDVGRGGAVAAADGPGDGAGPDLVGIGRLANDTIPGGVNVHLLSANGSGIAVRSYERGVGPTEACGTGACACAAAARAWGMVDDRVTVRMPGGEAEVLLGETVTLKGPATAVAAIEYPWPS